LHFFSSSLHGHGEEKENSYHIFLSEI